MLGPPARPFRLRKISGYEVPLFITQIVFVSLLFFTAKLRLSFLTKNKQKQHLVNIYEALVIL
ncbi:MAG: hypothetical protein D3906_04205 [Candidatus Electrothrix sp. AUS1_2]|nr:hypothetical protein [Candidatus Electrothrix sp. AUS1_2]